MKREQQEKILEIVARKPAISRKDLSVAMDLDRSVVGRYCRDLENRKLLKSDTFRTNKRFYTPEGYALHGRKPKSKNVIPGMSYLASVDHRYKERFNRINELMIPRLPA